MRISNAKLLCWNERTPVRFINCLDKTSHLLHVRQDVASVCASVPDSLRVCLNCRIYKRKHEIEYIPGAKKSNAVLFIIPFKLDSW